MKVVADIQGVDMTAYATSMAQISRAALSMQEAMRVSTENTGIARMLEAVKLHDAAMQVAAGPLEELRRSGFFDAKTFLDHDELAVIQQAMAGFEARFRLPDMTETARLLEEFQKSQFSATLAVHAAEIASLQHGMDSMRTPWLAVEDAMSSITGFAEIQKIGLAVARLPAFDESLSAALRVDLGDWREQITWRPEIFTDLVARSDFYASLGFNRALTDFPLSAFEQSLDIAGLRSPAPLIVEKRELVQPATGDGEEGGLTRTNAAHDRIQRLERRLRKFIDEEMTHAFGADWPKHRLPNGLYEQWQDRKKKAEQAGAEERPLVDYADFTDYALLICRSDNWREVFGAFFNRPESVRESFQRLYPIRLDTMHARLITQDDELFLHVEVRRLMKVISKPD
jgi:hypothetical protein